MKTVKTFSLLFFTAQNSLHRFPRKKYYSRTYPHKLLLRTVWCLRIVTDEERRVAPVFSPTPNGLDVEN